ncbi:MAG: hypothetical protein KDA65_03370 [Planctomycetaceae bacterium]|nr:hypothetical protein [Planctomycetaceae bacterium]
MSRRQQPQGMQVSLFPFLTVLLCAMGALIFLFLVITQQIRESSLAARQVALEEVEPEPVIEEMEIESSEPEVIDPEPVEPVDPNVPWRTRLRQLQQSWNERQQQQKQLSTQAEKVKHQLATYTETARDQLTKQQKIKTEIEKEQLLATEIKAEEQQLHSTGINLEKQIERKQTEVRTAQSEFAIIPYDGQLGTIRRPILIECQEDSITFYPEKVALTAQDLRGFDAYQNPLAAGAKALIEYWQEADRRAGKEVTKPYLLLIVRPSGSVSFYAAQKLLGSLEVQNGYELLPESYPVRWPKENPEATARCRAAVEEALKLQPSKQQMRMADLQLNNKRLTAEEFRRQPFDPEGLGSRRTLEAPAEDGGRKMKFDVNSGRFVEISEPPRKTSSHWENLDLDSPDSSPSPRTPTSKEGNTDKNHPTESAGIENADPNQNPFVNANPTGQKEEGSENAPPLLRLDESPALSEIKNGQQPGFSEEAPPFESGFSDLNKALKPMRDIDPREGLREEQQGSPAFGKGMPHSLSKPTTDSAGNPFAERPWYQTQSDSASQGGSGANCPSGMCPNPQLKEPGESVDQFHIPQRMRMQQKLRVLVDANSIQIEGSPPIEVNISRDDSEMADEFKDQIGKIVSTWSTLPPGFFWSPYMQFTVLPGGNVTLKRLLLQLPSREIDYETDIELEKSAPLPLDKPLLRDSIDKILLLQGETTTESSRSDSPEQEMTR